MTRHCIVLILTLCGASYSIGADWLQFRGNDTTSVSPDENLPCRISDATIKWSAELPGGGLSGPIVIGERVVVTTSSGFDQNRLHVLCFSTVSGEKQWERQFWATGSTTCHEIMRVAAPTPASDGARIYALYSSNDLACLDLDGHLIWYRSLGLEYPNASNSLGMASSPVVVGETVVLQIESDAEAFAMGIHTATGMTRWKIPRERTSNWTSPAIFRGDTRDLDRVVLQSAVGLDAVAPETGEIAWSYRQGTETRPSSTVWSGTVFGVSQGLTALKPNKLGDAVDLSWSEQKLAPGSPSPVVDAGRVYVVSGKILTAGDAQTGDVVWRMRVGGNSRYWSTPLLANHHLYLFDQNGVCRVIHLGEEKGTVVSEHELGGTILCTPGAANGAIFVRSYERLWKLAD